MLQQSHGPGGHVWARSCLTRDGDTGESVCRLSRCVYVAPPPVLTDMLGCERLT